MGIGNGNTGEAQTKSPRKYSTTYRSTKKNKEKYGELYEKTPILNKLPPIGTKVIVHETIDFQRAEGVLNNHLGHKVPDNCRDAWGRPAVFTVVGYSKGIENPQLPSNDAILERYDCIGRPVTKVRIRTYLISCGNINLVEHKKVMVD